LAAENARLRSEKSDAMSVVKEIYSDPAASPSLRLKAAGLALPHETPRLTPVPPAIDATCEKIIPLPQLIAERRAPVMRWSARCRISRSCLTAPFGFCPSLAAMAATTILLVELAIGKMTNGQINSQISLHLVVTGRDLLKSEAM
jgi:hypothetical protein